jgi:hypothetical protein
VVVVEGAQADEVGAVRGKLHAAGLRQARDGDVLLEALDHLAGDAGQRFTSLGVKRVNML